jgi:hypothetical protein
MVIYQEDAVLAFEKWALKRINEVSLIPFLFANMLEEPL